MIWSQKVESKIQRNRSKTTMASSERRSTVLRHRSSTQTLWAPPMINEKRHQSTKWNKDTKFVHRMQLDVGARPAKWRIWMGSSDFFRRPSKAFATNQLPPLCHLIHLLLNERKNKGKTWWDNDETLHDDTHLPRTPNPKRRICPDFSTNTLPIWSRQEAAIHLSFQYSCNECTYIKHDGLVLVLWVMEVAGMRWGEMWCCGRPR